MDAIRLWAKSKRGLADPQTVAEHCQLVKASAKTIWSIIAADLFCALKWTEAEIDHLKPLIEAAALLHDFAKCNSAFQSMLSNTGFRQPVRHEILAGVLLSQECHLGKWWSQLNEEVRWLVIWTVAAHHLKMGDPARGCKLYRQEEAPDFVTVPLTDESIKAQLNEAGQLLGISDINETRGIRFDTLEDDEQSLERSVARFAECSCDAWNRLRLQPGIKRKLSILKACLMAADAAGSADFASAGQPSQWIPLALNARITPELLTNIILEGTHGKRPLEFQKKVGESPTDATIVIAGCGNGKTTAAYLWAQRWANGKKLFFTYPTTGTASSGYEDYLFEDKSLASALVHGRALVDLRAMHGSSDSFEDDIARLEAIDNTWNRQAIVCTVDTVLGLLQNNRRPLYSFPAIAAGAFVFDEIHSYDAKLFGALLRFLEEFPGMPVLLMSASIPQNRLQKLKEVLGARYCESITGDSIKEGYKRYRLQSRESAEACQADVNKVLGKNGKVLWVCNTVGDCIKLARSAREWAKIEPENILIYHSRFRYGDRVKRQSSLINRFRGNGRVLAFTTQVCEMSLDISANLLVTAESPLSSLVQRLGRLNRFATKNDPWPCLVYPFSGMPYNEVAEKVQLHGDCRASMAAGRDAVMKLQGIPCSQADLADRLKLMSNNEVFDKYSAWLDDGWLTEPAAVRDSEQSITLIREEDLAEITKEKGPEHAKPSKWTAKELVPWTIPMLMKKGFYTEVRKGGYPIAPTGSVIYQESEGAEWAKNAK